MLHHLEIEVIRFLHQFRTPFIDQFFKTLDLFDRNEFFFILIPFVWFSIGKKPGLRLFCILFLSSLTNHILKAFFLSPRLFHLDPSLGIIQVDGWGFPSGAAQTVILLSGLLLKSWNNSWKWALIASYITLISFSRVFLGLHFPSDILGGWCVGFALLAIYIYFFPKLEAFFSSIKNYVLYTLMIGSPFILILLSEGLSIVRICSAFIGIGLGLFLSNRFELCFEPSSNRKRQRLLIAVIGVIGTFICYRLTSWLFPSTSKVFLFLQFSPIGIWLGLGGPIIYRLFHPQKESSSA